MMFLKGMEVVSALSFCVSRALVLALGVSLQPWLFNHEHKTSVPLSLCIRCECTGKDTKSTVFKVKLEHNCR